MSWRTQGVRFVLFSPAATAPPDAEQVWDTILSPRKPDTVARPQPSPLTTAAGVVRQTEISISTQPGRLDLTISPPLPQWSDPNENPPDLQQLLSSLAIYGKKCVVAYRSIRVAVVADLVKHASSAQQSYQFFLSELPFMPTELKVRDANFQINPTRNFRADQSVEMMRLCRWGTATVQIVNLPTAPAFSREISITRALTVLSLQTDFSSSPDRAEVLASDVAAIMLDELADETRLVVTEGYKGLAT